MDANLSPRLGPTPGGGNCNRSTATITIILQQWLPFVEVAVVAQVAFKIESTYGRLYGVLSFVASLSQSSSCFSRL